MGGAGLSCRWLGRLPYRRALELQESIVAAHPEHGDTLLLLEHDPVYTTGRRGLDANLPSDPAAEVVRIGRGGDATYHGPGQLVGYPLLDLRRRGADVHRYLRDLERLVIDLLGEFGVEGRRIEGKTGVWVVPTEGAERKIASIGIGVRRGISMHGFALNVTVDLTAFDTIVPCGLDGVDMTSLARETGREVPIEEVAGRAAALARRIFERPAG